MMSLSVWRLVRLLNRERNILGCRKSTNSGAQRVTHTQKPKQKRLPDGPSLEHFIANSNSSSKVKFVNADPLPYLHKKDLLGHGKKVYFDVHGCQMNTNDTEIAWAVLQDHGYLRTMDVKKADVILVMTCAIREGAEIKIWNKLKYLKILKEKYRPKMKIGVLGCMAERLKAKIIEQEKAVDVVCGPDAYRDLPRLLGSSFTGQTAVNVLLSLDETYADVLPVRLNEDAKIAYVSIMRGCDNMCSYCIVPFTRGRERSRPIDSIVEEVKHLSDQGVKEVVLLGQNVNSYRDTTESRVYGTPDLDKPTPIRDGFKTVYKTKYGGRRFSELLDRVSQVDQEMRIRFTAAHPKDFPDEVLYLIKERDNICNQLHLPCQSGSTDVLKAMRRGYSRESYLELVDHIRSIIPDVALTSDVISGFCGETDKDHRDTLDLLKIVKYSALYCFPYSMRQKTHAYHKLEDNVPDDTKAQRSAEVRQVYLREAEKLHETLLGQYHLVLVEKENQRSEILGRNDMGIAVALPQTKLLCNGTWKIPEPGDYVVAKIHGASAKAFQGHPIQYSSIKEFSLNSHLTETSGKQVPS